MYIAPVIPSSPGALYLSYREAEYRKHPVQDCCVDKMLVSFFRQRMHCVATILEGNDETRK
ncbi:hypothetical protein PPL_12059 [Heterostelium album PN500]|uniref:Uncharacterized protein n=1 Tax=Heterostelium pallidum (strain ATCC 26659 / Pp 5 / PN500) TaxID=670386 RepID=D3BLK6_HETP5|nr:hypothetical protein PPL_12059 [Heterostelium album PN500]EFA77457.1 hypothetical protein PPL_12059 [Heterostelium album PN500]|eukprot:XP_020429585.1 hypothetical protein PPL_12059 [Heterostelium album PN500]